MTASPEEEHVVVDRSALIDLMVTPDLGLLVESRIAGCILHAPAHIDAEVLAVLGRLEEAGVLRAPGVARHLDTLAAAPLERHPVSDLLAGAWRRRQRLRLNDAIYVELASSLNANLITTDPELDRASPVVELVSRPN